MARRSTGEGSLTLRPDGRWQAALQVDGRRRTVYGKTRQEAAAKLAELQRQANASGILAQPAKRTVGDLLDAWLEVKAPTWRPRTLADARTVCDAYLRPALGELALSKLTPDRIARLYAKWQKQGKHRTALKLHRALVQALAMAVRWGWLAANPCDRVDAPRYRPERKMLWTPEQLRRFLDATREHWLRPFWLVAIGSGCRLGELLRLTWADVGDAASPGARITIAQAKTRTGIRTVTLPAEAAAALESWRTAQQAERLWLGEAWTAGDLVFSSRRGAPLGQRVVEWNLARLCERLGLPRLTPHGLRHLHASLLLAQGVPIPAVSARLGHANSAVTMSVYAHHLGKGDAAATAAIEKALGA